MHINVVSPLFLTEQTAVADSHESQHVSLEMQETSSLSSTSSFPGFSILLGKCREVSHDSDNVMTPRMSAGGVGRMIVPHLGSGDRSDGRSRDSAPLLRSASGSEVAGPLDGRWLTTVHEGGTQRQHARPRSISDSASSFAGTRPVVIIGDGDRYGDCDGDAFDDVCSQQQGAAESPPPLRPHHFSSIRPPDGAWIIREDCRSLDISLTRCSEDGQGKNLMSSSCTAIRSSTQHPVDLPHLPNDFFTRCLLQQLVDQQAGPAAARSPLPVNDSALEQVLADLRPLRVPSCRRHNVPH